jgi:hypothetical protein
MYTPFSSDNMLHHSKQTLRILVYVHTKHNLIFCNLSMRPHRSRFTRDHRGAKVGTSFQIGLDLGVALNEGKHS